MLGLVHAPLRRATLGDLLALAEVALALPDHRRGRGVARLPPLDMAVVLAEAVQGAVEGREVDVAVGEDGAGDDLALDRLPPVFAARREVEAGEVMPVIARLSGKAMKTRPWLTAGMLISGSPSHFFQTGWPSTVRTSNSQLSVLNTTWPSSTTAAVGPSSEVWYCQARVPSAASKAKKS